MSDQHKRCWNCRWIREELSFYGSVCVRYPPSITVSLEQGDKQTFPSVAKEMQCGEWDWKGEGTK